MLRRPITSIRQNYYSILISGVGLGLLAIIATRPEKEVRILSSDLAFQMVCEGQASDSIEESIESFLKQHKFAALNMGKLRREHKGENKGSSSLVDIVGLDAEKRTISAFGLPQPADRYAISLRTPPPTKRADFLEHDLLMFTEKELGCTVRQITRSENTADRQDFYEMELKRLGGLFQQAEEFQRSRQRQ